METEAQKEHDVTRELGLSGTVKPHDRELERVSNLCKKLDRGKAILLLKCAVAPADVSQGEGIQLGGEKGRKEAGLPERVGGSGWCGRPMKGWGEVRRKDSKARTQEFWRE